MLGALAQQAGRFGAALEALRESLNRSAGFDFGALAALAHAREWQAK